MNMKQCKKCSAILEWYIQFIQSDANLLKEFYGTLTEQAQLEARGPLGKITGDHVG